MLRCNKDKAILLHRNKALEWQVTAFDWTENGKGKTDNLFEELLGLVAERMAVVPHGGAGVQRRDRRPR